jgi:UDP-N-acetylmuramate-alanine ligase
MSWLAMMLFDIGYKNIVCINNIQTDLTDRLTHHGLKVIIWHGKYTIDIKDFVIYSDIQAIIDGPEIAQSRIYQQSPTKKHFHICMTYNQFIAEISKHFTTVSVSGSNGKTSTTAMAIWTLSSLQGGETLFALWIVWWLMPNFDHQWYAISSDTQIQSDIHHLFEHIFNQKHQLDYSLIKKHLFVIEACEHREHFLLYDTDYTLITNIARDHTDYYHTRESYKEAFVHMIQKTRKASILTPSALATLSWYDLPDHVIVSEDFDFENPYLIWSYNASNAGMVRKLLHLLSSPSVPLLSEKDDHKTLAHETYPIDKSPSLLGEGLGWGLEEMKLKLSQFQWVGRRMEYIGQFSNKSIYSDYSHHAPAISGNMKALQQQFPEKKICAIFQPHQAQRVLVWRDQFKESLTQADTTIIYKLYTAREDFTSLQQEFPRLQWISSFDELGEQFARELNARYITQIDDIHSELQQLWEEYIIVVFSAGDLDEKMRKILQ